MTQIETTTRPTQLNQNQASWLFLPQGLVMPARIPMGGKEGEADPKFTDGGRLTIQVRARSEQHLKNVIRDYFEPLGLEYSEIQLTPQMDYNARFYTTPEALGQFYMQVALDTDALKFKPLAEDQNADGSYKYGTKAETSLYHHVLNSIWASVCGIGRPGGIWGSYSKSNPNGYKPAAKASRTSSYGGRIGDSFGSRLSDEVGLDSRYDGSPLFDEDFDFYSPNSAKRASDIIAEMEGIPQSEWDEYLTSDEIELVRPFMDEEGAVLPEAKLALEHSGAVQKMSRREIAKQNRKNRKNSRRYRRH